MNKEESVMKLVQKLYQFFINIQYQHSVSSRIIATLSINVVLFFFFIRTLLFPYTNLSLT